jgi:CRP-like cAMP-binding protein
MGILGGMAVPEDWDNPAIRHLGRLITLNEVGRNHLSNLTANVIELKPRRKLIDENRPSEQMYIVTSGWLTEYRQLRDGGRQILNFRLPGEVTGVECLLYKTALHSVAALTHCTVAPVSRDAFEQTQKQFPRLATAFLLSGLRDGAILQEWAVNLGRRAAFPRIAHLLLELERRLRSSGLAREQAVPFPLKQQDIADCTGLTTPYVNRVLQQMRGMGLIHMGEESLTICNAEELAKAAGFRPDYLLASPQTGWQSFFIQESASPPQLFPANVA